MKLNSLVATRVPQWFRQHHRNLPWRNTKNPYFIWVSEIMLQQTRVEAVIPYYHRFLAALPTVKDLAEAPEETLLKLWEGLGYYSRVRNMGKAARTVMAQYGGVFPQNFKDILSLSGIGAYTAGAIASFAFGLPHPAVDGNVLRVVARVADYREDVLSPAAKQELTAAVAEVLPPQEAGDFNQGLIELGATVCLPNGKPLCDSCPLSDICAAHRKGCETELPIRKKKAPRKILHRTVVIFRVEDKVALRKRPATGLLANLYEPFCVEHSFTEGELYHILQEKNISPLRLTPLGDAKHIFTHLEWHMQGYEVILTEADGKKLPSELSFVPRADIDRLYAVPSAFRAFRPFF